MQLAGASGRGGKGDGFLHFAAIGADGLAWDALGPRSLERAAEAYVEDARWSEINPHRFIAMQPDIDEDAITQACKDASPIFGSELAPISGAIPRTTIRREASA